MAGPYGIAPTPPRTGELWGSVLERLDSVTMQGVLGGAGRIFLITASGATTAQGAETQAWGRGVVAPIRRMFGEPEANLGQFRLISWLVRFDIHPPGGATGYDPALPLELAQAEAFARLHNWQPTGWTKASINRPIWRHSDPQSLPLWDNDTGVWFTSAEYRAWIAPA